MTAIRRFETGDTASATELLKDLPELYPDAGPWLTRRLEDCSRGRAWAWVAQDADRIIGVVILTPKGARLKISNLFVSETFRGQGVGRRLLVAASSIWADGTWKEVYVTAAMESVSGVAACVAPYGLRKMAVVRDRYGEGRDETVLAWARPTVLLSLRTRHVGRIYDGDKTWEFRRVRAGIHPGSRVLIYESGGVGAITGEFVVAERQVGPPAELVRLEPDELSRKDAADYLRGSAICTALRTHRVRRYVQPVMLAQLGVPRAPQSYMMLPQHDV